MDSASTTNYLLIHSGNILTSTTRNKGNDSPADEIFESLKSCIVDSGSITDLSNASEHGINSNIIELLPPVETSASAAGENAAPQSDGSSLVDQTLGIDRNELKVTLKLFSYAGAANDSDTVIKAIQKGLSSTSVSYADSIVISFSGQQDQPTVNNMEHLQNVWKELEFAVKENLVKMIGICDIDTGTFKALYHWANVKPSIVQINLASCCVVPPELSEFCKENQIQLLTHSDPQDILPEDKLEHLMKQFENSRSGMDAESKVIKQFKVKWIIRYQVHLKCRGVLSNKGYIAAISF